MLDLIALAAAVPQVAKGLAATVEKVREVKDGFGGKNAAAKEELNTKLTDLQTQLGNARKLATSAIEYSHTREDFAKLQALCTRIDSYLTENADECRNRAGAHFNSHWEFLRSMFGDLDVARGPSLDMIHNRAEYYDNRDRDQVEIYLGKFEEAFNEARANVKSQDANELLRQTGEMSDAMRHGDRVIRDTLYDTILSSLTGLGA